MLESLYAVMGTRPISGALMRGQFLDQYCMCENFLDICKRVFKKVPVGEKRQLICARECPVGGRCLLYENMEYLQKQ